MRLLPTLSLRRSGDQRAAADGGPEEDPLADEVFEETDETPLQFPERGVVTAKKRRRRGLTLILTGVLVLLGITATLYFSPLLTIRELELEHNDLLTDDRASELLQPVYGRPLPQVGSREVEELLGDQSIVDDVVVQSELPGTLHVEIIEHPPVAEVHDGDQIIFFNEHGEQIRVFDESQSSEAEDYATPVISSESALQDQAVFSTIVSVLGELPPGAREDMESATADSIDSVRLTLQDGRTVIWGSEEQGGEKAAVLQAILASDAEDFAQAESVDISAPDAPVIR